MSEITTRSRQNKLRVTTGCRTCRKRHVKCDEQKPTCANCAKKNRACQYGSSMRHEAPAKTRPVPVVPRNISPASGSHTSEPPATEALHSMLFGEIASSEPIYGGSVSVSYPSISTDSPVTPAIQNLESILLDGVERLADYQREYTAATGTLDVAEPGERIILNDDEVVILRNYVEHISHWIDSFSPDKPFHRAVPALALQCPPLLHACLALSSKQMMLAGKSTDVVQEGAELKHYREALSAISTVLWHNQYAHSDEVLAACVILSTYEMLDVVGESLGPHLKGVATLLQSRQIYGDMTGIRGACYWTWYRHEIWAALRTGRKMSFDETYWKPPAVSSFAHLSIEDIANRVLFLLGQCINSISNRGEDDDVPEGSWASSRSRQAASLKIELDRWKGMLPSSMNGFPVRNASRNGLPCTWFPYPQIAIAHQAYHACRIILSINNSQASSITEGSAFESFVSVRRQIADSCEQIFLVANSNIPDAFSLVSAQCLYIAGMVMDRSSRRKRTLELIEECQKRTGRKTMFLIDELRRLWGPESDT